MAMSPAEVDGDSVEGVRSRGREYPDELGAEKVVVDGVRTERRSGGSSRLNARSPGRQERRDGEGGDAGAQGAHELALVLHSVPRPLIGWSDHIQAAGKESRFPAQG